MATNSDVENLAIEPVHEPKVGLKTSQMVDNSHDNTRRSSLHDLQSSHNVVAQNRYPVSGAGPIKSERNDLHETTYDGDDQTPHAIASRPFGFDVDLESAKKKDVQIQHSLRGSMDGHVKNTTHIRKPLISTSSTLIESSESITNTPLGSDLSSRSSGSMEPARLGKRHKKPKHISSIFSILRCLTWIIVFNGGLIGSIVLFSLYGPETHCPSSLRHSIDDHAQWVCDSTRLSSFCPYVLYSVCGLYHYARTAWSVQQTLSFGDELAVEFARAYLNLSQVVAASNVLYQGPRTLDQRRLVLRGMKSGLPLDSAALESIVQFLDYTLHMDEELTNFTHMIAKVGDLAVRKHSVTKGILVTIQRTPPRITLLNAYARSIGWKTDQERVVQQQLKANIDVLRPTVDRAYALANEQLRRFGVVYQLAADIKIGSEEDKAQYARVVEDTMKSYHVIVRFAIKAVGYPEPPEIVHLTRGIAVANEVLRWTIDIAEWLDKLMPFLRDVKKGLDFISEALHEQDRTIRWVPNHEAKVAALGDFVIMVEQGMVPLRTNVHAGKQQLISSDE